MRIARRIWTLPTDVIGHIVGISAARHPPRRIKGMAAEGHLYIISSNSKLGPIGAVALGHIVLCRRDLCEGPVGRTLLAHELAHTRQHDVLGPFYLPLHAIAQLVSLVLSLVIPGKVPSRIHAYNPLEQTFICIGATIVRELADGKALSNNDREALFALLGV